MPLYGSDSSDSANSDDHRGSDSSSDRDSDDNRASSDSNRSSGSSSEDEDDPVRLARYGFGLTTSRARREALKALTDDEPGVSRHRRRRTRRLLVAQPLPEGDTEETNDENIDTAARDDVPSPSEAVPEGLEGKSASLIPQQTEVAEKAAEGDTPGPSEVLAPSLSKGALHRAKYAVASGNVAHPGLGLSGRQFLSSEEIDWTWRSLPVSARWSPHLEERRLFQALLGRSDGDASTDPSLKISPEQLFDKSTLESSSKEQFVPYWIEDRHALKHLATTTESVAARRDRLVAQVRAIDASIGLLPVTKVESSEHGKGNDAGSSASKNSMGTTLMPVLRPLLSHFATATALTQFRAPEAEDATKKKKDEPAGSFIPVEPSIEAKRVRIAEYLRHHKAVLAAKRRPRGIMARVRRYRDRGAGSDSESDSGAASEPNQADAESAMSFSDRLRQRRKEKKAGSLVELGSSLSQSVASSPSALPIMSRVVANTQSDAGSGSQMAVQLAVAILRRAAASDPELIADVVASVSSFQALPPLALRGVGYQEIFGDKGSPLPIHWSPFEKTLRGGIVSLVEFLWTVVSGQLAAEYDADKQHDHGRLSLGAILSLIRTTGSVAPVAFFVARLLSVDPTKDREQALRIHEVLQGSEVNVDTLVTLAEEAPVTSKGGKPTPDTVFVRRVPSVAMRAACVQTGDLESNRSVVGCDMVSTDGLVFLCDDMGLRQLDAETFELRSTKSLESLFGPKFTCGSSSTTSVSLGVLPGEKAEQLLLSAWKSSSSDEDQEGVEVACVIVDANTLEEQSGPEVDHICEWVAEHSRRHSGSSVMPTLCTHGSTLVIVSLELGDNGKPELSLRWCDSRNVTTGGELRHSLPQSSDFAELEESQDRDAPLLDQLASELAQAADMLCGANSGSRSVAAKIHEAAPCWINAFGEDGSIRILWSTLGSVEPAASHEKGPKLPTDGKNARQAELLIEMSWPSESAGASIQSAHVIRSSRGRNSSRKRRSWESAVDEHENAFISREVDATARCWIPREDGYLQFHHVSNYLEAVKSLTTPTPARDSVEASRAAELLCQVADAEPNAAAAVLAPRAIAATLISGLSARVSATLERGSASFDDIPFVVDAHPDTVFQLSTAAKNLCATMRVESESDVLTDLFAGVIDLLSQNVKSCALERHGHKAMGFTSLPKELSSSLWDLADYLLGFENGALVVPQGPSCSDFISSMLRLEDSVSLVRAPAMCSLLLRHARDSAAIQATCRMAVLPHIASCCEGASTLNDVLLSSGIAPFVEPLLQLVDMDDARVVRESARVLSSILCVAPLFDEESKFAATELEAWIACLVGVLTKAAEALEAVSDEGRELDVDRSVLSVIPIVCSTLRSFFSYGSSLGSNQSKDVALLAQVSTRIIDVFPRIGAVVSRLVLGSDDSSVRQLHSVIVDVWASAAAILVSGGAPTDQELAFRQSASAARLWEHGLASEEVENGKSVLGQLCVASRPLVAAEQQGNAEHTPALQLFERGRDVELARHELMVLRMKRPGTEELDLIERLTLAALIHISGLSGRAEQALAALVAEGSENDEFEDILQPLRPFWRAAFETRRWVTMTRQQVVQSGGSTAAKELCDEVVAKCRLLLRATVDGGEIPSSMPSAGSAGLRRSGILAKRSGSKDAIRKRSRAKDWASFFSSWRHSRVQDSSGSDTSTVVRDVSDFLQSQGSLSAPGILEVLTARADRARHRGIGLKNLGEALANAMNSSVATHDPAVAASDSDAPRVAPHPSPDSALWEVAQTVVVSLRSLSEDLSDSEGKAGSSLSFHYLSGLDGVSDAATVDVAKQFLVLLQAAVKICTNDAVPSACRSLLLETFNVSIRAYDIELLSDCGVFTALFSIAGRSIAPLHAVTAQTDETVELSRAAWLAFRVLILQVAPNVKPGHGSSVALSVLGSVISAACERLEAVEKNFATLREDSSADNDSRDSALKDAPSTGAAESSDGVSKLSSSEETALQLLRLLIALFDDMKAVQETDQPWLPSLVRALIAMVRHAPYRVQLLSCRLLQRALLMLPPPGKSLSLPSSGDLLVASDLDEVVFVSGDESTVASNEVEELLHVLFELIGVAFGAASTTFARKMTISARLTNDVVPLAAEAVSLLRMLLLSESSGWSQFVAGRLKDALGAVPAVCSEGSAQTSLAASTTIPSQTKILYAVAALCVLGGSTDVVRAGALVVGGTSGDEEKTKADKHKPSGGKRPSYYSTFDWSVVSEGNVVNGAAPPPYSACATCAGGDFTRVAGTSTRRSVVVEYDAHAGMATIADAEDLISVCQRPARAFRRNVPSQTLSAVTPRLESSGSNTIASLMMQFHDELLELLRFFLLTIGPGGVAPIDAAVSQPSQQRFSNHMLVAQLKARALKMLNTLLVSDHELARRIAADSGLGGALVSHALARGSTVSEFTTGEFTKRVGELSVAQLESTAAAMQSLLLCEKATVSVDIVVQVQKKVASSGKEEAETEDDDTPKQTRVKLSSKFSKTQDVVEKLLSSGQLTASQLRTARMEFAQLDLDGDGSITTDEFVESNAKRGVAVSDADMGRIQLLSRRRQKAHGDFRGDGLGFLDFVELMFNVSIGADETDDADEGSVDGPGRSVLNAAVVVRTPLALAGAYDIQLSSEFMSRAERQQLMATDAVEDSASTFGRGLASGKITVLRLSDEMHGDVDKDLHDRVVVVVCDLADSSAEPHVSHARAAGASGVIVVPHPMVAKVSADAKPKAETKSKKKKKKKDSSPDEGDASPEHGENSASESSYSESDVKDSSQVSAPVFITRDAKFLDVLHYLAALSMQSAPAAGVLEDSSMPLLVSAVRALLERDATPSVGQTFRPSHGGNTLPWDSDVLQKAVLESASELNIELSLVDTPEKAAAVASVVTCVVSAKLNFTKKLKPSERDGPSQRRKTKLGDSDESDLDTAFETLFGDGEESSDAAVQSEETNKPSVETNTGGGLFAAISRLFGGRGSSSPATPASEQVSPEDPKSADQSDDGDEDIDDSDSGDDMLGSGSDDSDSMHLSSSSSSASSSSLDLNLFGNSSDSSDSDSSIDFEDAISSWGASEDTDNNANFMRQFATMKKATRAEWKSRVDGALSASGMTNMDWLALRRPFFEVTHVEERLTQLYARQACLQWLTSLQDTPTESAVLSPSQACQVLAVALTLPQWCPNSDSSALLHAATCPGDSAARQRFELIDSLRALTEDENGTAFDNSLWWVAAGHAARFGQAQELQRDRAKRLKKEIAIKKQIKKGKPPKSSSGSEAQKEDQVPSKGDDAQGSKEDSDASGASIDLKALTKAAADCAVAGDSSDASVISLSEMLVDYLASRSPNKSSLQAFYALLLSTRQVRGRDRLRLLRAATGVVETALLVPLPDTTLGDGSEPQAKLDSSSDEDDSKQLSTGCVLCRGFNKGPEGLSDMLRSWAEEVTEALDPENIPDTDEDRACAPLWAQDRLQFLAAFDKAYIRHKGSCTRPVPKDEQDPKEESDDDSDDPSEAPSGKEFEAACGSRLLAEADADKESSSKGSLSVEDVHNNGHEDRRSDGVWRVSCRRRNQFATFCVKGIGCQTGKWYYEVALESDGRTQLGWASVGFREAQRGGSHEHGVGDSDDSWAIDPRRCCLWHAGKATPLLPALPANASKADAAKRRMSASGDVWGLLLDCDAHEMKFSRNGVVLDLSVPLPLVSDSAASVNPRPANEPAFRDMSLVGGVVPAVSAAKDTHVEVRTTSDSLQHLPDGYKPVNEAPKPKYVSPMKRYMRLRGLLAAMVVPEPIPTECWEAAVPEALVPKDGNCPTWPLGHYRQLAQLGDLLGPDKFADVTRLTKAIRTGDMPRDLAVWLDSEDVGGPQELVRRWALAKLLNEDLRSSLRYVNFYYAQPDRPLPSERSGKVPTLAELADPLFRSPYTLMGSKWDDQERLRAVKFLINQETAVAHVRACIAAMPSSTRYYYNRIHLPISRPLAMRQTERTWVNGNDLHSSIGQAYEQMTLREGDKPKVWFREQPLFRVKFLGEGSEDDGGPYHELLSGMAAELQSDTVSLFVQTPNGRTNMGENRGCFQLRSTAVGPQQLAILAFFGKIIGAQSIRCKTTFSLALPSLVWKHFCAEEVVLDDLRKTDLLCANTVEAILSGQLDSDVASAAGVDDSMDESTDSTPVSSGKDEADDGDDNTESSRKKLLFSEVIGNETFSVPASDGTMVDLVPNGCDRAVTYDNHREWVERVQEFRLREECARQAAAFRAGMSCVIPLNVVDSLLSHKGLEHLVCGNPGIDFGMLKRHAQYNGGFSPSHQTIKWLWKALESFTVEEQQSFLRFSCGRTRYAFRLEYFCFCFNLLI
jgi:HECT-domain (ubiquitin-transferase)/SPRY domain